MFLSIAQNSFRALHHVAARHTTPHSMHMFLIDKYTHKPAYLGQSSASAQLEEIRRITETDAIQPQFYINWFASIDVYDYVCPYIKAEWLRRKTIWLLLGECICECIPGLFLLLLNSKFIQKSHPMPLQDAQ